MPGDKRDRSTPPPGLPILVDGDSDKTPRPQEPPRTPIDQVRQDLRDEEWRRERDARNLTAAIAADHERLVDIAGQDGKDGKLGKLAETVALMRGILVAVAVAACGSAITAGLALYHAGEGSGALDQWRKQVDAALLEQRAVDEQLFATFYHLPYVTPPAIPSAPGASP